MEGRMGLTNDRTERHRLMQQARENLAKNPELREDLCQRMSAAEKKTTRGPSSDKHRKPARQPSGVGLAAAPLPPPASSPCPDCGTTHLLDGECKLHRNGNGAH